jgi:glycosyltransferase involved in cell wall biosynthesis
MKVLIVDRTNTDIGGVKTYVSNLERLLGELGCDTYVYSTKKNGSLLDKFLIGGVRYLINKIYRPYGIVIDTIMFSWLEWWILPKKYDFVVYQSLAVQRHGRMSASVVHALWTDNLQGIQLKDTAVKRCLNFERALLNDHRYFNFTVSDSYAGLISERHSCKRIPVIENFLFEDFQSQDWSNRDIDIIYTGQFNSRKNIPLLLKIVKKLVNRASPRYFKVILIGGGPDEAEIKEYIRVNTLTNIVKLIDSPPRQVIKDYLSRSKIFMLTSSKESFSFSLLEAKLSGCITFATDGLEVPEGFVDCNIGDGKIDEIVELIESALSASSTPYHMFNSNYSNPLELAKEKYSKLLTDGLV